MKIKKTAMQILFSQYTVQTSPKVTQSHQNKEIGQDVVSGKMNVLSNVLPVEPLKSSLLDIQDVKLGVYQNNILNVSDDTKSIEILEVLR